jgi:hypothetical protein
MLLPLPSVLKSRFDKTLRNHLHCLSPTAGRLDNSLVFQADQAALRQPLLVPRF